MAVHCGHVVGDQVAAVHGCDQCRSSPPDCGERAQPGEAQQGQM